MSNATQKAFGNIAEDLDSCRLTKQLSNEHAQSIGQMLVASEPWASLKFSAASLANYLTRDDAALHRYMVTVDGQVAGIICVRHPWLRGPYIELLGISPDYQGLGIGKQVLGWVETEARREAKNLWVISSSFNHEALSFYQRFGFTRIGAIEGLITPEHDEILLRKVLG